jgi:hypothetical protein
VRTAANTRRFLAVERLIDAVNPAEMSGTLVLLPLNQRAVVRKDHTARQSDGQQEHEPVLSWRPERHADRSRVVCRHEGSRRACDHLIDLHGGDLDENLRPYSYWTVTGNQKQDELSRAMVLAFGLDHIIVSTDRPKDPKASRFLENTATTRGKPSFTLKPALGAGQRRRRDAARQRRPERDGTPQDDRASGDAGQESDLDRAGRVDHRGTEGVFHPRVDRDAHVAKGAAIGVVTDYHNRRFRRSRRPTRASSCLSVRCHR